MNNPDYEDLQAQRQQLADDARAWAEVGTQLARRARELGVRLEVNVHISAWYPQIDRIECEVYEEPTKY